MMYLKFLVISLVLFFSIFSHGSDDNLLNNFIRNVELADRALLYEDIKAMKIMGTKLEQAGFPDESFKYWLKATKKGDKESRIKLQGLYDQGAGTRSERREAFVLLGFRKCLARLFRW